MSTVNSPRNELLAEIESLRLRLEKAEESLADIDSGEESRDVSDRKRSEASPLESGNMYPAMSDITERKQMMLSLCRAKEELEHRVEERTRDLQESESKYRIIFNNEIYAIIIFEPKTGEILDVNDAHIAMYGYSREELLSRITAYDLTAEPETSIDSVKGIVEHGTKFVPLRHHRKKDGTIFPVEIVGGSYLWKGRQVMFGMTHDITERKLAEETLQNLNAYNRTLIEASIDPLVTIDAGGKIADVNSATEQVTGYQRLELIGADFSEFFTEPEKAREGYQHVFKEGLVRDYPLEIRHRDGHKTPVLYNATVYHDKFGNIRGVFAAARDITKRKQAEAEREQLYKFFLTSTDIMVIADPNGVFLKTNPACMELLGYSAAELESKPFIDFVHPDDKQKTLDEMAWQQEIGYTIAFENRYVCKDGSFRWLSWRAVYNKDEHCAYATGRDITLNKQQEEAIRKSEREFRLLAEAMPQIVWITGPDGKNIYFNQQWVDYTGLTLEESYGDGWNKPFHPDDQQAAWNAWLNATTYGHRYSLESRLRRADGVYKWWLVRGVPVLDEHGAVLKWFGTCTDIDDVKKAEEERLTFEQRMLQTQKLESLGILAGGIAHDFNNILMAIIGHASLALMRLNPESPAVANLQQIEQASERAADLARQMLAYSGKGKFMIEPLDLNRLLEEMTHMLEVSIISKKAVLRLNLPPDIPAVEADATQIRQIIMNLVINASEAIGDTSGVIDIATGFVTCDKGYFNEFWLDENMGEGLYVSLEVTDTGCGMSKDILDKIFDPFFTTKFAGRGLGMAAVQGIIRGHKGAIKVYSEPGKGTTFRVLLPASGEAAGIVAGEKVKDDWKGSGAVLLVDDEKIVQVVGAEMLKALGFTVIAANDGKEAVEIFRTRDDIDVVLLDLTMPEMDGEQCFRELQRISPDVKVIMTSGYSEQEIIQRFTGKGLAGFIQKPYTLSALKEVFRKID